ncbi:MAG: AmmeMemoRadiSam system radical SAM enzyme [Candidatus Hydrothermarchaeaceae archaeon]
MIEAWCWESHDAVAECNLCIINCKINDGKKGFCGVRENRGGKLYSLIYGKLSSFSTDFIEKAPCYHFYPNHKFLTIGSVGCNLRCKFCLTWSITQVDPQSVRTDELGVEKIVRSAKELGCRGIVYTHSEPTLNIEYYAKLMKKAKGGGLVNVFATNGLISLEAFDLIADRLDVVTLTIKGDRNFYNKVCGVDFDKVHLSNLAKAINARNVHLEIVYVLIPGHNDDLDSLIELIEFVKDANAPLIFLRFFPSYKMDNQGSTPEEGLEHALNLAYQKGLKYVYVENIYSHPGKNTYCERCKKPVIKREGYGIVEWNLEEDSCKFCGAKIPIIGGERP